MMDALADTKPRLMRVDAVMEVAEETKMVSLIPVDAQCVTPAEPGAHIDLHLPNGMVRSSPLPR